MKIGFDGKRAVLNNTGLGNYSRLLVDVLASKYPEHQYKLYTPEIKANDRLDTVLSHDNVELAAPDTSLGEKAPAVWRSLGLSAQLRRDHIDLYHGLSGELPINIAGAGIPSVVTIHDLIFRRFPENYKAVDRRIYDFKFRKAAQAADRVLAISECTRRDLINDYNIDPDKIDVVYQGCAAQFKRTPSADEVNAIKKKYGLDRPYIISVGTIEKRKNQILAVRGVRGLPEEFDVVLVGRRTPEAAAVIDQYIKSFSMEDRVKFIEQAPFADLPALYAGAYCSSYTSHYEGFGIPVIESLAAGTPVVVATGSCLEEAGGPMTPAVDPYNVEEWINTVKELINYPSQGRAIVEAGRRHIARFSDENMAAGTMEVYRKAIDHHNATHNITE